MSLDTLEAPQYAAYDPSIVVGYAEQGDCGGVFEAPRSSYTRALLDAIPLPEPMPGWLES